MLANSTAASCRGQRDGRDSRSPWRPLWDSRLYNMKTDAAVLGVAVMLERRMKMNGGKVASEPIEDLVVPSLRLGVLMPGCPKMIRRRGSVWCVREGKGDIDAGLGRG